MLAAIPYFEIPVLDIGPVVIDSWAALVCTGFILGLEIARARGIKMGLDVRDVIDGIVVTVGMGFLVGHIVHVVAYNPQQLDDQGIMAILKVWAGFSSTGGFLGAVIGSLLFYKVIRKRPYWIHADTIMFGFPFGWMFGRLGCFTAHDHIGRRTDFFLAVDFPDLAWTNGAGARHDLGLYEALWTMVIAATFFALRNKKLRPGFFLALFTVMYAPVRLVLDFLRAEDVHGADVRWGGLTPAQYGAIAMFLAGLWLMARLSRAPESEASAGEGEAPTGEGEAGEGEASAGEGPTGEGEAGADQSDSASS